MTIRKNSKQLSPKYVHYEQRFSNRLQEEYKGLDRLSKQDSSLSFSPTRFGFMLHFRRTPGLLQTAHGVSIWNLWDVRIVLTPKFPIDPPLVFVAPFGCTGRPVHPNILPVPPFRVCYGEFRANEMLDALAIRLQRLLEMRPEIVMTDEHDALNPAFCHIARRLIREKYVPMTSETELPKWVRSIRQVLERTR